MSEDRPQYQAERTVPTRAEIAERLRMDPFHASGFWVFPFRERNDNYATVADLNDSGLTFAQIADLIEYFY